MCKKLDYNEPEEYPASVMRLGSIFNVGSVGYDDIHVLEVGGSTHWVLSSFET